MTPVSAAPPRVFMVLKRPCGGRGLQLQARRVTRRLHELGVECTLLCHAPTVRAAARLRRWQPPARGIEAPSGARFHLRLAQELRRARGEYDLVHVHGYGHEMLGAALGACFAGGRPVVVKPGTDFARTLLGAWAEGRRRPPWLPWLFRRGVTRWVAISDRVRHDLERAGVPPQRIVRIQNGVDTLAFSPAGPPERAALRAGFGIAADETVVTAVARLERHKRLELLIHAAAALAPRFPGLRVWIIGDGEERRRLGTLAAALAPGRVEIFGRLQPTAIAPRLQASDLYVACSDAEGLSNALLEAMACALPPVATRVSGSEDLILDGVNGRLVAPGDVDGLARALAALLADPRERTKCGAAALATVRDRCSLDRTAERLLDLYRDCLARSRP